MTKDVGSQLKHVDTMTYMQYAEEQVLKIVGASLSDKTQRDDAKAAVRYVFGETMRSFYGVDKPKLK